MLQTLITGRGSFELVSKQNTGSGVWADTAYRSKKNEAFLERDMFKSNIQQGRMPRRPLPKHIARANTNRSALRSEVELVFAGMSEWQMCVVIIADSESPLYRSTRDNNVALRTPHELTS